VEEHGRGATICSHLPEPWEGKGSAERSEQAAYKPGWMASFPHATLRAPANKAAFARHFSSLLKALGWVGVPPWVSASKGNPRQALSPLTQVTKQGLSFTLVVKPWSMPFYPRGLDEVWSRLLIPSVL